MQWYVVTRFMATYGSRPFDTLDFAEAKRPEEATEPPWGPSRKTARGLSEPFPRGPVKTSP